MEAFCRFYVGLMLIAFLTMARGYDNLRAIINQLNFLERDVNQIKFEVPRFEERVINKIGMLEQILRADLVEAIVPSFIHTEVKKTLTKELGDQSIAAINNHLRLEMRHLKQGFQQRMRQLQIYVDTEREKQRQDVERLQRELASERLYYDTQVSYIQAELDITRQDISSLEQEVSFLVRENVLLNGSRKEEYESKHSAEGCDFGKLSEKITQNRIMTIQMIEDLARNVSSLQSMIADQESDDFANGREKVDVSSEEDDLTIQSKGGEVGDSSEEEDLSMPRHGDKKVDDSSEEIQDNVTNELQTQLDVTEIRLEQIEENTRQLGKNLTWMKETMNVKLQDISLNCKCVSQFVSPQQPAGMASQLSTKSVSSEQSLTILKSFLPFRPSSFLPTPQSSIVSPSVSTHVSIQPSEQLPFPLSTQIP